MPTPLPEQEKRCAKRITPLSGEESVVRWGTEVPCSSVFGRCFTMAPVAWGHVDLGYFAPVPVHPDVVTLLSLADSLGAS